MRRLVIDSATEACSVALFDGAELIAGTHAMLGRGHAEQLVPMIAALPGKGRADAIAVNAGPGSFTGIRVGLAAARALALAWQVPIEGYSCLALVAAMARAANPDAAIDVVMSGGHGEWFFQPFAANGAALAETASLLPEAAAAHSAAGIVVGSQAEALAARRGAGAAAHPLWPDARAFALLGSAALRPDPLPRYGRAPDARLPAATQPAA
ncbi:tRNA (adenosine(37)-N6)-threonylcarbamoyltransferase complex dimerization subunit type 1 TsaB [Novosphingobium sp. PASSN1]|uniref:tRNA (adenosine(37)-N6)-threonylcarbamoyltransferase complex dimerization subunit type 1 TsaB n=1 Tax=Novosphingobium sp. PASSN1 TaxID=2015561 RepID=UPI000BC4692C|nr:tRNA (adenosine(37)-N6)-threonylcarbamoyltransferase complex dimerization subunit type 1 TsaB [Novosphingobium sp. PASSN1]OYU35001.1 MAG: tRNA (adenosine(37)-N6)-threonylcarbamoyltransferase complex dimerization subunit type 1 TsaB [Novosphingobium sp. PASSN1]